MAYRAYFVTLRFLGSMNEAKARQELKHFSIFKSYKQVPPKGPSQAPEANQQQQNWNLKMNRASKLKTDPINHFCIDEEYSSPVRYSISGYCSVKGHLLLEVSGSEYSSSLIKKIPDIIRLKFLSYIIHLN